MMTLREGLGRLGAQEDLNFLLTNRLPRRLATRAMGRISRIEQPLVRDASLALWRLFCDVDLSDARKTRFTSLHDAFVRELRPGARRIDPDPDTLVSPSDAILGAHGAVAAGQVFQVKGSPYRLADLLQDEALARSHEGCAYATLRLTAGMYHRFHAPADGRVESVRHLWGDTWNVNPIALKRVEALFCRNERAVIRVRLPDGAAMTLVPVAAILVAGLKLGFLPEGGEPARHGRAGAALRRQARAGQGDGLVRARLDHRGPGPPGYTIAPGLKEGARLRMGEALLRGPAHGA